MVTLAYQGIPSVVVYEVNRRTSLTSGLPGVHSYGPILYWLQTQEADTNITLGLTPGFPKRLFMLFIHLLAGTRRLSNQNTYSQTGVSVCSCFSILLDILPFV